MIEANRPGGFLDFLPEECIARTQMIRTITQTFASFGFDPIETPIVEFRHILQSEEGETGKQIFSITSHETTGEDLALRFDHTVPLARLLAQNPYNAHTKTGIKLPWRRMTVGPVFRGERQQKGRYRQFYQYDVDIVGTNEMLAEVELITMMHATLTNLGVERFTIRLNNRKILNALAEIAGFAGAKNADDLTKNMMRILDKIDKIGIDDVMTLLQEDETLSLTDDALRAIGTFLTIDGDNAAKLSACRALFATSEIAHEGITELETILTTLEQSEAVRECVSIDFSIARGLDYYTGPVMETTLHDAPEFGSVFSGGRYDGLVKRFTGQELPAVGVSIGVDRLFRALVELGLFDTKQKTTVDVMIMRIMPDADATYLGYARRLRGAGLNVEVSLLRDTTFKNQFNYALSRGARYIVICGQEEYDQKTVQIKDTHTRAQDTVPVDDIEKYFISGKL